MKSSIKDMLALIGAAYLAWLVFNFLVSSGLLHITGLGQ